MIECPPSNGKCEVHMTSQRWLWSCAVSVVMIVTFSAQTTKPTFEVASVKKRNQPAPFVPTRTPPGSPVFYMANATVASLIQFAYNVRDSQVIGGPDWIRKDQFEINARAAAEVSNDEKRPMVQSLLEERFRLVLRKEQRETQFAALVVGREDGRLGPTLTKCTDPNAPLPKVLIPRGGRASVRPCAAISDIVNLASGILGILVLDKTGLTGMWRYELVFAESQPLPAPVGRDLGEPANLPSFSIALQEQLGLRLESTRGSADVLVVESVQQPAEN